MKQVYLLTLILSLAVMNIFAQAPVITQQPDASGPLQVCEGGDITISIAATGASAYQWEVNSTLIGTWTPISVAIPVLQSLDASLDVSGESTNTLQINKADNLLDSLQFRCVTGDGLILNPLTNKTISTEHFLTVNALPSIDRDSAVLRGCDIADIDLSMSNLNPFDLLTCQYNLYRDQDTILTLNDGNPQSILGHFPFQVDTAGTYYYSVVNNDNPTCKRIDTVDVTVQYVYEKEQLGLVTFDPSIGRNILVWNKTDSVGTDSFKIYTGAASPIAIGAQGFSNTSIFVDTTAPGGQPVQYSMEIIDSCGHTSNLSASLLGMLMTIDTTNGITLNWNDYVGVLFNEFYIHRGTNPLTLENATNIIDTVANVAGTVNSWTDSLPPSMDSSVYYMVSIQLPQVINVLGAKKANSGPFSRSLSNIEDNRQQGYDPNYVKLINSKEAINFAVYPNPFDNQATINYQLNRTSNVKLDVVNILGQTEMELVNQKQSNGNYNFNINKNQLSGSGMYFITLWVDNVPSTKKVIVR